MTGVNMLARVSLRTRGDVYESKGLVAYPVDRHAQWPDVFRDHGLPGPFQDAEPCFGTDIPHFLADALTEMPGCFALPSEAAFDGDGLRDTERAAEVLVGEVEDQLFGAKPRAGVESVELRPVFQLADIGLRGRRREQDRVYAALPVDGDGRIDPPKVYTEDCRALCHLHPRVEDLCHPRMVEFFVPPVSGPVLRLRDPAEGWCSTACPVSGDDLAGSLDAAIAAAGHDARELVASVLAGIPESSPDTRALFEGVIGSAFQAQ